jgi:hypothetical protein
MKTRLIGLLALAGLFAAGNASADFAVGVKGGTLGAGVEATIGISKRFNARLGYNAYDFDTEEEADDIEYDATLELKSAGLMLDIHPFAGAFRITVGMLSNSNQILMNATPTANQEIGGTTYTPAQIGTLSGEVTFKKSSPYFGIGWGNAVSEGWPLGMSFELGIVKQGKPQVAFSSTGTVSQADLDAEADNAEEDLKDFDGYPVIALGFSWRF